MLGIIKYIGFFILFGLGIGQSLLYRKIKRNWSSLPVVRGKIIESKLIDHNDIDGNRVYKASIRCRYNHLGTDYESEATVLRSAQLVPSFNYENQLVQRYKKESNVEIRVLPKKPDVAIIELAPLNKTSVILVPLIIVGYAFLVFGYGWAMHEIFTFES
ncbi:DUF3592 domain-containing protein [Pseudomonadales bacterium]|nr:DUF3592 domain-containing protein [Pseudomonadales bacterium]